MTRPRILLADDHRIVAEGLRSILEPEFELVAEVADGRAMIEAAERLRPDVIVADISMPLLNGIEAARQLQAKGIETRIVFLTMHPDVTYAAAALSAGAAGYVLKHSASDELITAIRQALVGRRFVSPALTGDDLYRALRAHGREAQASLSLSPRQREVLQLLAEGKSAKEIAALLDISPRTVESHKYKMMEDLGLSASAELVQYAIKHGIVSA